METTKMGSRGGCQDYGPFLDPSYNTAHIIFRVPKKGHRDHNVDNHPAG